MILINQVIHVSGTFLSLEKFPHNILSVRLYFSIIVLHKILYLFTLQNKFFFIKTKKISAVGVKRGLH